MKSRNKRKEIDPCDYIENDKPWKSVADEERIFEEVDEIDEIEEIAHLKRADQILHDA